MKTIVNKITEYDYEMLSISIFKHSSIRPNFVFIWYIDDKKKPDFMGCFPDFSQAARFFYMFIF
jgi:hypothetical protein